MCRSGRRWSLRDHAGPHSTHVGSGGRPGSDRRLRSMPSWHSDTWMRLERTAVTNGRRCRWRVMSDLGEVRMWLTREMRRHHLVVGSLWAARGGSITVFVVFVVVTTVEIGRTFVLIGTSMLSKLSAGDYTRGLANCGERAQYSQIGIAGSGLAYLLMSTRRASCCYQK